MHFISSSSFAQNYYCPQGKRGYFFIIKLQDHHKSQNYGLISSFTQAGLALYSACIQFQRMLQRSELLPGISTEGRRQCSISSERGSGLNQGLSKSSVSSKSLTTQQSLQGQIVLLKEKAHQSFMQVIQMQQLHQQQLEELRNDFALKQSDYQLRIAELELRAQKAQDLEVKIKQLEFENFTLEKNYKHHNCEFEQDQLQIDNIELIACREESKLDDSAIINFQEIIKPQQKEQQLKQLKNQIVDEITGITKDGNHQGALKMLNQLFQYINLLKIELFRFQERQLEKQKETKDNQSTKFYDSLQKESKFMTEHIKRLSADKMKLQKRLSEVQRHAKNLQQKLGKIQAAVTKRGLSLPELGIKIISPPQQQAQQQEHSLDLNEFIAQNLRKANSPANKNQFGIIKKSKN